MGHGCGEISHTKFESVFCISSVKQVEFRHKIFRLLYAIQCNSNFYVFIYLKHGKQPDVLFFTSMHLNLPSKKGVNRLVKVELRRNETQRQLLKRFRKSVSRSGKLRAVRQKRWYVSKSERRRTQKKKAIRRKKLRKIKRRKRK